MGLLFSDNEKCLFGEMVSTSNTYDGSPEVEIQTDSPILWSMCTIGLKCKIWWTISLCYIFSVVKYLCYTINSVDLGSY